MANTLEDCRSVLRLAEEKGKKVVLPVDSVVTQPGEDKAYVIDHQEDRFPDDALALDVGPRTVKMIGDSITNAKAVVWNGPLGYFEDERFQLGSLAVAKTIEEYHPPTLIGGGDTLSVLKKADISQQTIHICTGGGAMLAMLMGRELPAIEALKPF
jgi:phosphoglycerate kinase